MELVQQSAEPWMDSDAIAKYIGGVDLSTIQRWCAESDFPHVRANRRGKILSRASWIDRWLMQNAKHVG